ncbi:MAG: energy transducer TonB [Acidobacteria bacterium]|nr:energy transducer TonB [Acidobacteriota bacterium]
MGESLLARVPAEQANYGFKTAVVFSIVLHVGAITAMVLAGLIKANQRPPQMQAIAVGIADPAIAQKGGKEHKAPVMRNQQKKQPPQQKSTAKPAQKPNDAQVGLNRDKKPIKKPEPTTVKDDPAPPVVNETKRTDVGGTGGAEESGVAFDLAGPVNLNQDVEFIEYYRSVLEEVSRRWTKGGLEGGTTKVTFDILRDGSIKNVEIAQSSGKSFLDGPAKRAVLSSRFPPLPQGYRDDKLIFTINFKYGE